MRSFSLAFLLLLVIGAGCANNKPSESLQDIQVEVTTEGNVTVTPVEEEPAAETQDEARVEPDAATEQETAAAEPLLVSMVSDNFSFSPDVITAKPGQTVLITFANAGVHTFAIDEIQLDEAIAAGQTLSFTAPTTPGTYPYYCSVGSHAALGMKGKLIVQE